MKPPFCLVVGEGPAGINPKNTLPLRSGLAADTNLILRFSLGFAKCRRPERVFLTFIPAGPSFHEKAGTEISDSLRNFLFSTHFVIFLFVALSRYRVHLLTKIKTTAAINLLTPAAA